MGPWHRTGDARVKQYENKFGKKQTNNGCPGENNNKTQPTQQVNPNGTKIERALKELINQVQGTKTWAEGEFIGSGMSSSW
jgi:hypothetical protein